jgi:hypothetical protein
MVKENIEETENGLETRNKGKANHKGENRDRHKTLTNFTDLSKRKLRLGKQRKQREPRRKMNLESDSWSDSWTATLILTFNLILQLCCCCCDQR